MWLGPSARQAGNSGVNADASPMSPAAYNNRGIVSVLATDASDLSAGFTSHGMLLEHFAVRIIEDPSAQGVREAARVIHHTEAAMLAAARQAEVDCLVSWPSLTSAGRISIEPT